MGDRCAIQGEEGSNSAVAARQLLGPHVELLFCPSFAEAVAAIASGAASRGVLPVENTTAGLVQEVWDWLFGVTGGPTLSAKAEARVPISFVAAGLTGARERVRRVLAHPVAAAQCRRFLAASGWEVVPSHDTAGAARLVREKADPTTAALCPPSAATTYQLEVFAEGCGDSSRTWTRFLLVEPGPPAPSAVDDRALLVLTLPDAPGSLVRALFAFSSRGLNLCALHSRALPGRPGEYAFLVEVQAGAGDPRTEAALRELRALEAQVRTLGSFRAAAWPGA